jgi:hypothetical protein
MNGDDLVDIFPRIEPKYNLKTKLTDKKGKKLDKGIYLFNNERINKVLKTQRKIRLKPINLNEYNINEKEENQKDNKSKDFKLIINKELISDRSKKSNNLQLKKSYSNLYNKILSNYKSSINDNKQQDNTTCDKGTSSKRIGNTKSHYFKINNNNIISHKIKRPNLSGRNNIKSNNIYSSNTNISSFNDINKRKNKLSLEGFPFLNDYQKKNNSTVHEKEINNIINYDNNASHNSRLQEKLSSKNSKSNFNIFISQLVSKKKNNQERKFSGKIYNKKWDLPKVISFKKIRGRYKENKNLLKYCFLERIKDYSPKYGLVLCNSQKAFVQYGKDNKKEFKNYKINMIRKAICNQKILNNSGSNYNIINLIKEEEEKKKKRKNKKLEQLFNIEEQFNYFIKKNKCFSNNSMNNLDKK